MYVSFCALAAHRFVAHLMLGVLLCARVVFVAATLLIPTWIRPRVCTVGQAGRPLARSRSACRRRVPGRSSAPGGRWRRAGPSRGRMACPGPVEPRARKFEANRVVPRGPGASRWLSAKDDSSFTRESYGVLWSRICRSTQDVAKLREVNIQFMLAQSRLVHLDADANVAGWRGLAQVPDERPVILTVLGTRGPLCAKFVNDGPFGSLAHHVPG